MRFLKLMLISAILSGTAFAQFKNIQVNKSTRPKPEEVTISINPLNPKNLAAGANIDYYYYTEDGGLTWNEGRLTSTLGVWGDPCVVFDGDGNLYFGHLSNPAHGHWIDRIVVQKSVDGGKQWNDGVGIGYLPFKNQDKEWLAVDLTTSEFRNNLYMAWTEFDQYGSSDSNDSTRILFSRSTDQGDSWMEPIKISNKGGNCIDGDETVEGAVPAVGPNGEIYISWTGPYGIVFDKSLDGGQTFGKDIYVTNVPGGWAFDIPGIFRSNGLPVTACDISNSTYRGTIYILWSDQRNGEDDTDVFLIKSKDGGKSWSQIKRVNDDQTGRHQFFPWIAIDQTTGYIYIVFYDRRNTEGVDTDVYLARSADGGDTFYNFKISKSSFTPVDDVFFGDYINIAANDGMIYPIWMRLDQRELSVWMSIVEDTKLDVNYTDETPMVRDFQLFQNYPNPFNGSTEITFLVKKQSNIQINIYNIVGEFVCQLVNKQYQPGKYSLTWHGVDLQQRSLPGGVYFYRMKTTSSKISKKMIMLM